MKKLKQIGFEILMHNIMKRYYPCHYYLYRNYASHSDAYRFEHYKGIMWYLHRDHPRICKLIAYLRPELKELS